MKRLLFFLALLLVAYGEYRIGVGIVDVSPSQAEIRSRRIFLGGYGFLGFRDGPIPKPARGVHDPVWARSFLVSDQNNTFVTTILDNPGISNKILDRIRKGASDLTGIRPENILVGATHTHSGPDLQGLWGFVTDSYLDFVVAGAVDSIVQAFRTRVPGRLYVSGGEGYARNRRGWEFTDTELTVLDGRDMNGNRIATFINFAAHTTAIGNSNLDVSSDWVHYVREEGEGVLKAPVVFSNGAIGDVTPQPFGEGDQFDRARNYGYDIARLAIESMSNQIEISPFLHLVTEPITFEVSNYLFIAALRLGIIDYDYMGDPETGYSIKSRATYFRLGNEVQGCAFPGESLTRNGLSIKEAMKSEHRLFLGLNGDTLGYFVPSDEWEGGVGGGYEESISLGENVGDQARDFIVSLVQSDPSFP